MEENKAIRVISAALLLSVVCVSYCIWAKTEVKDVRSGRARPVPQATHGPATEAAAKVLKETFRILANLKSTKYSGRTHVDEAKGIYEMDCSGLVCYVLKRALPKHYKNIRRVVGKSRPLAADFFYCFSKAPASEKGRKGWRRVRHPLGARPGDIIAWRAKKPRPGYTGHVVIVAGMPQRGPDRQVHVQVVESGGGGVGRTQMWFKLDYRKGRIAGYRRGNPNAKLHKFAIQPVIGRPVDLKEEVKQTTSAKSQN